jgi:acetylornithine deacetylase
MATSSEKSTFERYDEARTLMDLMVTNSQIPGEGNERFVNTLGAYLADQGFQVSTVQDPELPDRSLLVVDIGDPNGEQILTAISHSDVVGVEGQNWRHDPHTLTEEEGRWLGRGVCDTHGSGISMLLAGSQPEVIEALKAEKKRVSVIFTYNEESTSADLSMRGARLAVGGFGVNPVATSKFYIAGEPTEIDGEIRAAHAHKGRWLAHFKVTVEHAGHVSDLVQNALQSGSNIVHDINRYAKMLPLGSTNDVEASIYNPPHSTIQVSAAEVKSGDYSTTPNYARFTVDMRTIPEAHDWRAIEMRDLILYALSEPGVTVDLDIEKNAPGSLTLRESPIVQAAERFTGYKSRGFNGGDEGRIMRLDGGMQGVTIGPGSLNFAHMPNEEIKIASIPKAAKIYEQMFLAAIQFDQ